MKVNKFEEIISNAINKLKPLLTATEAVSFDQMLSTLFLIYAPSQRK